MAIKKNTIPNIVTGEGALPALNAFLKKSAYDSYFILCDEHTSQHCLPTLLFHCEALLSAEIIELESGEAHKTIDTCVTVWSAMQELMAGRKSLVVNLGGGVITDIGGFIASVYKRGIDFVNVPTTLLGMVDASVGGKNGVDFNGIKNQLGTIVQPKLVVVNPGFLDTLPDRHISNGIAEIIKIALVADAAFYETLQGFDSRTGYCDEKIISHAIRLKCEVVKQDPDERHLRKSLNFGHSIGHALESACLESGMDVLHGEAVAAGMVMETYLAHEAGLCTKAFLNSVVKAMASHFKKVPVSKKTESLMLQHVKHDKKNIGDTLVFAIAKKPGEFGLLSLSSPKGISAAISFYNSL